LFKQNDIHLPKYNTLWLPYQVCHEVLWALRAALWLEPFKSISCWFNQVDTLLAQICELYHLIKWLPNIEFMTMSLPVWVPRGSKLRLDVRQWFKAVTMLLQVAIEKGCKQMSILGGGEIESFYSMPEAALPVVPLKTLEKKRSFIPG